MAIDSGTVGTEFGRWTRPKAVRTLAALSLLLLTGLVFVGCGLATSTSGNSQPAVGKLAPAEFPACAQQGLQVARYLLTGRPELLDPNYASVRAQILQAPKAAQGGLIRAEADHIIAICDSQEQAQMQAQASASASAQASASAASLEVQFANSCVALGGSVHSTPYGPSCDVNYPDFPDQQVPLNPNGTLNQGDAQAAKAQCATDLESERLDAQDGVPWAVLPQFHPNTGICTPGSPSG